MKARDPRNSPQRQSSRGIDLLGCIDSLIDHKKTIATIAIGIFVLGSAYAFLAPPVFEADALIKVADSDKQPPPTADTLNYYVAPSFNETSSAEGAIQVIGSRRIVGEAVANNRLDIEATPLRFPLIGSAIARHSDGLSEPGVLGLGGFLWGTENIDVSVFTVPAKLEGKKFTLRAVASGQYELSGPGLSRTLSGRVDTPEQFNSEYGPIALRVDSIHSKAGGEFVLTRHSDLLLIGELQKKLKLVEAGTKTNVVKIALQGTDAARVAATVKAISELYLDWNKARKARIAQAALDQVKDVLPAMEKQVSDAETAYNNYRDMNGIVDVSEEGKLLLKQIADNSAALLDLKRRRQAMSATLAPGNLNVVAADQQIDATERAIAALNLRLRAMPRAEQGALQLMRNVRVNTDLYVSMRKYADEMQLVSAEKAGAAEIIDPAEVPTRPVRPVKWLIMLGSLLLGVVVGGGGAILWDRLRQGLGVTDIDDIESITGLTVYATVPESDRQQEIMRRADQGLPQQLPLAASYPRTPAIESLRMLRSAIQLMLLGAPNNVVMLAGPTSGTGKSFLAANLATVLAAGGKRILLIDGDMRKGELHRYLGTGNGEGLSEVLSGERRMDEVITASHTPNLDLVRAGSYPPAPADLLITGRFGECVEAVSTAYDIVLIDTPAVLAVSDAGMMAPAAGSVFLIVRFADTLAGEINATIKRLAHAGGRISGMVLNRVRVRNINSALARRYGTYAYVAKEETREH